MKPDFYRALYQILDGKIPTQIALQPIFGFRDHEVYGHEVLARWSTFPPDEVFRCAHERNLVPDLEKVLLDNIISIRNVIDGRLFINLHPTLPQPDKWNVLRNKNVILEITELTNIQYEGIKVLKDLGFKLALDDIGTGSATLENLTRLQPDYLKLDKILVQSQNVFARNSLIKAFVDHACRLNAKVIIEGIETLEQYNAAKDTGAHYGQGYFLGKPKLINSI